ncbi:bifunctional RNase H/acid phosphatase [Nocardioides panacisoli]|uniref:Bifunctional RNase H/acid phosphatase n=1 Tax=Nocardioides panacisoli TaxID=627624 RepID=A0ABP7INT0_9ACTN
MSTADGPRSVVIEADGGSRGNPGPAAYGAVLKDAETGAVIAEDGTSIGVATNNVAEYSGLIAGLKLAAEHAPNADIAVRMDSKLVVEQMSGRWKIKHPDMRPLALEAKRLLPPMRDVSFTWIPREQNKHADRLANEALDGKRSGVTVAAAPDAAAEPDSAIEAVEEPRPEAAAPVTLLLVRHGATVHTASRRFSGGLGGDNPGLSDEGRAQVEAAGAWLGSHVDEVTTIVCSPVRRTRESAAILGKLLDLPIEESAGLAEMEFGAWDGMTFPEVMAKDKAAFDAWVSDLDTPPPGGESFRTVQRRVLTALDEIERRHAGATVIVVSHVTPIKMLVAEAVGAPLGALFRMELDPASVSAVSFFRDQRTGDRRGSLKAYNITG